MIVNLRGLKDKSILRERQESIIDLWFFIIVITTTLALLINILSLHLGKTDVAPHLLYIPVIIAAYWYPRKGLIFSLFISAVYLALVWFFTAGSPASVVAAIVTCIVLVGVAAVIASLSSHMCRSEMKYRGIFNHSEAGVGLIDIPSLSILEVNSRFASILGFDKTELSQIPFSQLWAKAESKDEFFRILNREGSIENTETRLVSKTSGPRWILISAGMLPDNQFVCTIVDITDRKQAEEALLIKNHAINSSINAIAIIDLDYKMTYVNRSCLEIMGYFHKEELVDKDVRQLISPDAPFDEILAALEKNDSWFGEIVLIKYDRKPFYALLWANKVKDENGNPLCLMASFIDISESKQLENVKRQSLEQIEKNIEQFAILGDHIRNPLAVIVGLSSLAPGEISEKIILQAREIDRIVTQLDQGWIESEKVREFIKRYYKVGTDDASDKDRSSKQRK
jgi:PAS domain S-box-containing protein